jgi:hypothetical protein
MTGGQNGSSELVGVMNDDIRFQPNILELCERGLNPAGEYGCGDSPRLDVRQVPQRRSAVEGVRLHLVDIRAGRITTEPERLDALPERRTGTERERKHRMQVAIAWNAGEQDQHPRKRSPGDWFSSMRCGGGGGDCYQAPGLCPRSRARRRKASCTGRWARWCLPSPFSADV